jgi:hypothetical protein
MSVNSVNETNYTVGSIVEICDGRVGVETYRMHLITVLQNNTQYTEIFEGPNLIKVII